MPTMVFSTVDLPAPLRPSRATISWSLHVERHVAQDVALAVEGVDVRKPQQRPPAAPPILAPSRRAHARRRRCRPPAPAASCAHPRPCRRPAPAPSFITVTASAIRNTRSMSCSTSSTGNPRRDAPDQVADALALGRRKARQRLVEQQQARPHRERERHVEQALAAVGQRARLRRLDALEPHRADDLQRSRR